MAQLLCGAAWIERQTLRPKTWPFALLVVHLALSSPWAPPPSMVPAPPSSSPRPSPEHPRHPSSLSSAVPRGCATDGGRVRPVRGSLQTLWHCCRKRKAGCFVALCLLGTFHSPLELLFSLLVTFRGWFLWASTCDYIWKPLISWSPFTMLSVAETVPSGPWNSLSIVEDTWLWSEGLEWGSAVSSPPWPWPLL